jgi:hypothetical protein
VVEGEGWGGQDLEEKNEGDCGSHWSLVGSLVFFLWGFYGGVGFCSWV